MSVKEYNFEDFTSKDDFQNKLKGAIPCFGYISASKRAKFIQFLVDNNFIKFETTTADLFDGADSNLPHVLLKMKNVKQKYNALYTVVSQFRYHALGTKKSAYRTASIVIAEDTQIITDKSSRLITLGRGI